MNCNDSTEECPVCHKRDCVAYEILPDFIRYVCRKCANLWTLEVNHNLCSKIEHSTAGGK